MLSCYYTHIDANVAITVFTISRCIRRYHVGTIFGCDYDQRTKTNQRFIKCPDDDFECKTSKRCIPRHWVRDGSSDCSFNDVSDETMIDNTRV